MPRSKLRRALKKTLEEKGSKADKERAGKGGIVPPKEHRFSSEKQPSPQAKSEGLKKWYEREKYLDAIMELFAEEITLSDGKTLPGTMLLAMKVKKSLISPKVDKLSLEQIRVILRFIELLTKQQHRTEQREELPPEAGQKPQEQRKLTFVEFCRNASYPTPFKKQIEMKDFALSGGAKMVLGSRGYGKTDYISICGIAYDIYLNPAVSWLLVTKEKSRGADIVLEVAYVLEANGVKLERKSSKQIRVAGHIGKDANLSALPIRSKGFRGKHPTHILCDDIITPDDVSKAERARVESVVDELFKLTPNITLLGQPVHAKDIYAKFRRQKGVEKMEVPYGSIPELDHDLEAQRAAGVNESSIQASYFLKIGAADRLPFANLESVDFFPQGTCAGFIDPSHEGNDYTAFALCAANFDTLVFAGFAWQKAWDDCLDDIAEIMRAYNCTRFAFETNGVGKHPVSVLRQMGANVKGWKSTGNKHARIMNAAIYRESIKLSDYLPAALDNTAFREAQRNFNTMVRDYEYNAEHDDAPDALASLLGFLGKIKNEHKGHI